MLKGFNKLKKGVEVNYPFTTAAYDQLGGNFKRKLSRSVCYQLVDGKCEIEFYEFAGKAISKCNLQHFHFAIPLVVDLIEMNFLIIVRAHCSTHNGAVEATT